MRGQRGYLAVVGDLVEVGAHLGDENAHGADVALACGQHEGRESAELLGHVDQLVDAVYPVQHVRAIPRSQGLDPPLAIDVPRGLGTGGGAGGGLANGANRPHIPQLSRLAQRRYALTFTRVV
jgi:hypothetical protein